MKNARKTNTRFGCLYAERQGDTVSIAVACYDPASRVCPGMNLDVRPYRSAGGIPLQDAVDWAAGAWCGEMLTSGLEDCLLLIEASCGAGARTGRTYGQNIVGIIPAVSIPDESHPYRILAMAARRSVRRLPVQVSSVIKDAAMSYADEMPVNAVQALSEAWPDATDEEQQAVYDACQDLERAWDGDDAAAAYHAETKLASLLQAMLRDDTKTKEATAC